MTFLPIVQRELRVAARRRSTIRVRWWAALVGIVMAFVSLALVQISSGRRVAGTSVFIILASYVFGLCLLGGVFLTADVLSIEKRAGTLGLLFLTDLKGYDVVLGKFMAQALTAFYCLLALLPALALPLLLGGVTGGEFWRLVLALMAMLFFSLATGMLISAFGFEERKTMGNTFWLLVLISIGLPILTSVGSKVAPSPTWSLLDWLSPSSPARYVRRPQLFWQDLLITGCAASLLLALASMVLPRVWQEGRRKVALPVREHSERLRQRTNASKYVKARIELLERNPVAWLVMQRMGAQWGGWLVVGFWAILVCSMALLQPATATTPFLASYVVAPFGFCLKLIFALQAGRLFTEHRRSGALELLLSTPLTNREIVRGQLLAFVRTFRRPFGAFMALLFAPLAIHLASSVFQADWPQTMLALSGMLVGGLFAVRFGLDLAAMYYFGNGMALTLNRPQQTPALTALFVLILPSILSPCMLDLIADIVFIVWGANKLNQDIRRALSREFQPIYLPQTILTPGVANARLL